MIKWRWQHGVGFNFSYSLFVFVSPLWLLKCRTSDSPTRYLRFKCYNLLLFKTHPPSPLQLCHQDQWGEPTCGKTGDLVEKIKSWFYHISQTFSIGLLFDIDKKGFENEKTPIPCMGTIPKYNCHLAVPWWWPRLIWSCRINGDWSKSQTNYILNLNMLNLPRTVPLLKNCLCITCSKRYSPCLILAFVLFSSLFGFISFLSSRALISNWNPSLSP